MSIESQTMEEVINKHEGALYKGLTRYQHVERLGHEEVEGLLSGAGLDDPLVVQNKIDGANMTVAWDPNEGLLIASRNQMVSIGDDIKKKDKMFLAAREYILGTPGFLQLFSDYPCWVLRGEWLVKHTLAYNKEAYAKFYVFDVQLTGTYLPPNVYEPVLSNHGILYIPTVATFDVAPSLDELVKVSQGPDEFGATQKEGIVLKRYGYVNKWGRTQWGKIVSLDFKEQAKKVWGGTKKDAPELRLLNLVTQGLVHKTIYKVSDQRGESPRVQHMPEVINRVWHDVFMEELWDFVKKEHINEFNFRDAQKLTFNKAREIALDFYNGVPTVTIYSQDNGKDTN